MVQYKEKAGHSWVEGWIEARGPPGPGPMNKSETKHLFALTLPCSLSSTAAICVIRAVIEPFFARSVGHSRRNRVLNPLVDLSVDFLKKGREGWFLNGYINPQRKLGSLMPP